MAKRGAGSELNRDNWDDEDDVEEAGTFTVASDEDLNKRKIIKARRRLPSDPKSKTSSGVFQKFTGFSGLTSMSNNTDSSSKSLPGLSSWGSSAQKTETKTAPSLSGFTGFAGLAATNSNGSSANDTFSTSSWPKFNGSKENKKTDALDDKNTNDVYLENIKALNLGVCSWIQKHVDQNPYVDLMPVFNDYRKHMEELESKLSPSKDSPGVKPLSSITPPSSSFASKPDSINEQQSSKSLNFESTNVAEVKNEEKPFAGLAEAAMATKTKENNTTGNEEEPSDEPPKPKSVVTAEEGSKFSVRCKLFFKRNNAWSELGVGMLNIKDKDGKSQLLVRADTATGNILLNIFIASSMPVTRSGKNNVMLVSIPNPPLYSKPSEGDNDKPATYLIRVKTAENADELFQKLEERKSS